jgi:hypothetical protein
MPPTSPEHASARPPHPLAVELIAVLGVGGARVIDFASGSGRNARALRAAGFERTSGRFAAALSTHGLLHGTLEVIGAAIEAIAAKLEPGGRLFATFGSVRDARFARGLEIERFVYAPLDGDERGVAHAFFDEPRLRALLEGRFLLESVEVRNADEIAGDWAHSEKPLRSSAHWFVRARKRD